MHVWQKKVTGVGRLAGAMGQQTRKAQGKSASYGPWEHGGVLAVNQTDCRCACVAGLEEVRHIKEDCQLSGRVQERKDIRRQYGGGALTTQEEIVWF